MFVRMLVLTLGAACAASVATFADEPGKASGGFRFAPVSEQSLGLWEGDQPVLVYNHGAIARPDLSGARPRACYFHPVYGLDGEVLTDDFPKDHLYHRGLYAAWPHIKIGEREYETWTARGDLEQRFVRWLTKDANADGARWDIENGWFIGGQCAVREEWRLTVHPAAADSRAIDIELAWTPLAEPLTLWGAEGKSYGGLNVRFGSRTRPAITVSPDSQLAAKADEGRIADDLVVTRLPWADFSGQFAGAKEPSGAAIFIHPRHPDFPPTWMARHYGLMSVGWPGVEPKTFPAGDKIVCSYRLWIHRGSPPAAEIAWAFDAYRRSAK